MLWLSVYPHACIYVSAYKCTCMYCCDMCLCACECVCKAVWPNPAAMSAFDIMYVYLSCMIYSKPLLRDFAAGFGQAKCRRVEHLSTIRRVSRVPPTGERLKYAVYREKSSNVVVSTSCSLPHHLTKELFQPQRLKYAVYREKSSNVVVSTSCSLPHYLTKELFQPLQFKCV